MKRFLLSFLMILTISHLFCQRLIYSKTYTFGYADKDMNETHTVPAGRVWVIQKIFGITAIGIGSGESMIAIGQTDGGAARIYVNGKEFYASFPLYINPLTAVMFSVMKGGYVSVDEYIESA